MAERELAFADATVSWLVLTEASVVDDLPPCLFYAPTAVATALGLPGSTGPRFGMCIRSSLASSSTGLMCLWAADATPASYFERRRFTAGWREWTQIR